MEHLRIFSATLGISPPWQVTEVLFCTDEGRVTISVEYMRDHQFTCPTCHSVISSVDSAVEVWRHASFFRHTAYLHARVPNVVCPTCGLIAIDRPWCREGSKFKLLSSVAATS